MIDKILTILNEKVIELKITTKIYKQNKIGIVKEKQLIKILQKAKAVFIQVGEKTQGEIKQYIEETVTLALQAVYGEDYQFLIEFDYTKREQFEVYFYVNHLNIKLEPRQDTCSGGVIDVCAFALRMVCLTLEKPDIASILILDEPFKNVSAGFIPATSQMVVDISELLKLQIIMITHEKGFIETANNIIYI